MDRASFWDHKNVFISAIALAIQELDNWSFNFYPNFWKDATATYIVSPNSE